MPFEIVPPGTHIDFIGRRHIAFAASGLLFLAALAAVFVEGVHLGIDFAGGTEVQLRFDVAPKADRIAFMLRHWRQPPPRY